MIEKPNQTDDYIDMTSIEPPGTPQKTTTTKQKQTYIKLKPTVLNKKSDYIIQWKLTLIKDQS